MATNHRLHMKITNKHLQQKRHCVSHRISWRSINIILGCACLACGVFYLVGMNDLTVKGFVLRDMKSRINLLAGENQDLQAKALTLQSYTALSPRLQGLNMIAVDDVAYISAQEAVLAKK
jgi:hypothetical protein